MNALIHMYKNHVLNYELWILILLKCHIAIMIICINIDNACVSGISTCINTITVVIRY